MCAARALERISRTVYAVAARSSAISSVHVHTARTNKSTPTREREEGGGEEEPDKRDLAGHMW